MFINSSSESLLFFDSSAHNITSLSEKSPTIKGIESAKCALAKRIQEADQELCNKLLRLNRSQTIVDIIERYLCLGIFDWPDEIQLVNLENGTDFPTSDIKDVLLPSENSAPIDMQIKISNSWFHGATCNLLIEVTNLFTDFDDGWSGCLVLENGQVNQSNSFKLQANNVNKRLMYIWGTLTPSWQYTKARIMVLLWKDNSYKLVEGKTLDLKWLTNEYWICLEDGVKRDPPFSPYSLSLDVLVKSKVQDEELSELGIGGFACLTLEASSLAHLRARIEILKSKYLQVKRNWAPLLPTAKEFCQLLKTEVESKSCIPEVDHFAAILLTELQTSKDIIENDNGGIF